MTPDEVRSVVGVEYTSFKRTSSADLPCDYFEPKEIFVYYKLPGVVEAIEFAPPANPTFDGANLLELSFDKLKEFLRKYDSELEVEEDSLTSYCLGVGAYASNAIEDPNSPPESIIVFEQGYYDFN